MHRIIIIVASFWLMGFTKPPEQYDHPYKGQLVVQQAPIKLLRFLCRNAPQGRLAIGCTFKLVDACYIYIANSVNKIMYPQLFRHEQAHCNGWPNNHPQ
jgi:hypothetical protein